MKKKQYQSPRMKVVEVNAQQIICASPGGTKSMYEVDLDSSGFVEQCW